jgi:hypothetical protein
MRPVVDALAPGAKLTKAGAARQARLVAADPFVVVVVPPKAPPHMGQKLAEAAVNTIQTEPWPAGLVINTKSTPP